jgi:hypothetical protein
MCKEGHVVLNGDMKSGPPEPQPNNNNNSICNGFSCTFGAREAAKGKLIIGLVRNL